MKRLWMLTILMIVLAGCGGSAAPGGGQCNQGLCVKIEVAEPIRWGEPLLVQITVTSKDDISDLGISLIYTEKRIVVEEAESTEQGEVVWKGDRGLDWKVSIKAGQPVVLTRKLHLPAREGLVELMASAITPQGLRAVDSVRIYLTREGGVVNPTPAALPGTPELAATVPPEWLLTPFPTPTPWPTPFPPPTSLSPIPTPTQLPYPFISPISTPTPAAHP
ncbi:hypothetical protein D6833_10595 [Candidatus Parcubacteria bacterium]|nr:MAG: hypothetical protein D6833_10595 [Candidatus Parcubacteria bacterium]